jgi:hypothetical protein
MILKNEVRILRVEDLLAAQACEKAVRDELNVLCHEAGVHADELAIQGLADELALDLNSTADDFLHDLFGELILHHGVQQAGEIGVETLVAGDKLVGESKTGHEATLLEPVDGAERSGKENTLDAGEGNLNIFWKRKFELETCKMYTILEVFESESQFDFFEQDARRRKSCR